MSISAYRKVMSVTESPREMERRILSEINAALMVHADHFDEASKGERLSILAGSLRAALAKNLKMWSALRIDLLNPGNALPEETRASLISLSLFVERETTAIMGGRGKVHALIGINASIMEGLAGRVPEAA